MIVVILVYAVLAVLAVLVVTRGQRPEQLAAALFVAAGLGSRGVISFGIEHASRIVTGLLAIDVAVLVGLLVIGIRLRRTWCLWAAAFQIISTLAHLARFVDPTFDANAYALMESASSLPQIMLLAVALVRYPRRISLI